MTDIKSNYSAISSPLISVITVVLNDGAQLEGTIKSVINQTYKNIEYLLIDGGSTDGTLAIIKNYHDQIDYWISEKDNGIYDAFNKGAKLAHGEWIIYMNAGDRFHTSNVIAHIFSQDCSQYDMIYGSQAVNYCDRFIRVQTAGRVDELWKGMHFSHQSTFMRTSLVRKGFNLDNAISADFEMIYSLMKEKGNFLHVNEIIATVRSGGFPDTDRVNSIKSQWKVVSSYGQSLKVNIYYIWQIIGTIIKGIIKKFLPQSLIDKIIKLK